MNRMMIRGGIAAGMAFSLFALSACSQSDQETPPVHATQEVGSETLVSALAETPDLSQMTTAISLAKMGSMFDGSASHTILAPTNSAFENLGEQAIDITLEDQRPVLMAVLREHTLPGHLTAENLSSAIDGKGGPVTMKTLGGTNVIFAKDDAGISVSNGLGSVAHLTGNTISASNGAIIPIDAILVPREEPGS